LISESAKRTGMCLVIYVRKKLAGTYMIVGKVMEGGGGGRVWYSDDASRVKVWGGKLLQKA